MKISNIHYLQIYIYHKVPLKSDEGSHSHLWRYSKTNQRILNEGELHF